MFSLQGIMHKTKPIFTAQFHPEAFGGPTDTQVLSLNLSDLWSMFLISKIHCNFFFIQGCPHVCFISLLLNCFGIYCYFRIQYVITVPKFRVHISTQISWEFFFLVKNHHPWTWRSGSYVNTTGLAIFTGVICMWQQRNLPFSGLKWQEQQCTGCKIYSHLKGKHSTRSDYIIRKSILYSYDNINFNEPLEEVSNS